MKELIAAAALLFMVPALASAQNTHHRDPGQGYLFLGESAGIIPGGNTLMPGGVEYVFPVDMRVQQLGLGGEAFLHEGLGAGAEVSHASWAGNNAAWIVSGDLSYHFRRHARRGGVDPFVLGGVSIVSATEAGTGRASPAGNFGVGANVWLAKHAALRFECRDVVGANSWSFSHVVSFRIGVTFR
jgi:hypothetical protein